MAWKISDIIAKDVYSNIVKPLGVPALSAVLLYLEGCDLLVQMGVCFLLFGLCLLLFWVTKEYMYIILPPFGLVVLLGKSPMQRPSKLDLFIGASMYQILSLFPDGSVDFLSRMSSPHRLDWYRLLWSV